MSRFLSQEVALLHSINNGWLDFKLTTNYNGTTHSFQSIYRNCDVLPIDYDLLIVMFVSTIIFMLNKILRVCLFWLKLLTLFHSWITSQGLCSKFIVQMCVGMISNKALKANSTISPIAFVFLIQHSLKRKVVKLKGGSLSCRR
mgnify:CR=1 FL=1